MKNTIAKYTRSPFKSKTPGSDAGNAPDGRADDVNEPGIDLPAEALNIEEIPFDGLNTGDTLIVQTRNSAYTFSVIDASDLLGTLTGGALEGVVDARLVKVGSNKLTVGSPAVFLLESSSGIKRLSTSPITVLSFKEGSGR